MVYGHSINDPVGNMYTGLVYRETVMIALTYEYFNVLDVLSYDIQNTYLTKSATENHLIVCGDEFGSYNIVMDEVVKRPLYVRKAEGRDSRNHLRDFMDRLGYMSCKDDSDLCMRL